MSVLLAIIGIAVIYSLIFTQPDNTLATKQLIFFLIALVFVLILSATNYRVFSGVSWYLYIGSIILLILVDVFGKTTGGATRWIDLKIFQLQPSELYKFVSVIFLASFFSTRVGRVRLVDIIYMFLMLLPALFLTLIQPDLGTALVIIFSWFSVVLFSKLKLKQYLFLFLSVVLLISIFVMSVYKIKPFEPILKDYQRARVLTFLDPSLDPFGRGYNVTQSQIAIGSGGIFGKGLGHGSQSQLKFLPKPETDFIFSGFSEAFGFVGNLILLVVYLVLLFRIIDISKIVKDNFGYLLSVGFGATFIFQIVVNIAMNIGWAPVTGIPLPFLSYGGSSLLTSFLMIGVLESIYIHRKKLSF
ncbi:MAG: Uncharacterized protein Athens101428_248 [Candidatus Berkelbacteria bacterium Athens1014_28]|uniref:Rod shape-determining protein RodA n=1 Tax=Candidatus Berkelbacteria bacterium Athens1014_28 TaxID=2017145 RepID=A0A554LNT2_9BACT|nr:MAG: Uncharacterized protein Athens101428_248 [Candidatus Berkelbacteria bacterium Athens1014_28]